MKGLKEVVFVFVVVMVIVFGSDLAGDRGYILRLVQSGGHESIYLLVGAALGFVLKDSSEEHGLIALAAAVTAVIASMLLGAFTSLEHDLAWMAGSFLVSIFVSGLLYSIFQLFRALKGYGRKVSRPVQMDRPKFVRTPPPRHRR
ncbi:MULTISPECIES: hypothetical protein [Halomonas]|uniref:hypothetical protein n=1 Tax=Halomonas TaxID=2745 RepID=UPI0013C2AD28|nr:MULTISPECIES: hypothetical protein [Halomonas]